MPRASRAVFAAVAFALAGVGGATASPEDAPVGDRLAGANRYATAAVLASQQFASRVYVGSGRAFPDALAAGPAASANDGVVLLTEPDVVPAETANELAQREHPEIVLLGGEGAVSAAVEDELRRYGAVRRLAGGDRYETAARITLDSFAGPVDTVLIATGEAFPDALAASAAGSARGWPVLLTRRDELPKATDDALVQLRPVRVLIVGDAGVVSTEVESALKGRATRVERAAGADRYATAAAVAEVAYPLAPVGDYTRAVLATGEDFPDALAAAPFSAGVGPFLLVRGQCIPEPAVEQLLRLDISKTVTVGGRNVVAPEVTAGLACDRPCPTPDRALQFGAARDPRLCVLLASDRTENLAYAGFDAELIVKNSSGETVTISHPSNCVVFYGRFEEDGTYVHGGPTCSGPPSTTRVAAGERLRFPIRFDNGRDGTAVFAAGLNTGLSGTYGIGAVWYAQERVMSLSAP